MKSKGVKRLSGTSCSISLTGLEMNRHPSFRAFMPQQAKTNRLFDFQARWKILPGLRILSGSSDLLDLPHQVDRAAELLFEECHLALADAVFAGAGAVHRQARGR